MLGSRFSLDRLAEWLAGQAYASRRAGNARLGSGASFPPLTLADAAGLLDRAQISLAQTVILGRVFPCGLEAILRNGSTDLIALTGRWCALRVAVGR